MTDASLAQHLRTRPRDAAWLAAQLGPSYRERLRALPDVSCVGGGHIYRLWWYIDSGHATLKRALASIAAVEPGRWFERTTSRKRAR